MPGRLLNGQQQKDPKHKVKADEHRPNVVIPIKPSGTPQSIEQDVTPKGIKQAHQDQDDLQSALTLHTALLFGKTNFRIHIVLMVDPTVQHMKWKSKDNPTE